MYKVDPSLLERFNSSYQVESENNDPRPEVYITRNRTAISTQRFWEKKQISSVVGTRSSIAVRRPKYSTLGDMIFVAQVESGVAVIRYAYENPNMARMKWTELTRIENVSEISLMFDGTMVKRNGIVEAYTVGDKPYAIYVDSYGSLKAVNLDSTNLEEITISDLAVNVASVRGLYSEVAGVDDGIFIFYTNTLGELWEVQMLDGVVQYLSKINRFPSGVTAWLDCWATLTFDYRVMLQLKGNDGNVYTLPSKSRPSGFTTFDHMQLSKIVTSGNSGVIPPVPLNSYNVGV